MRYIFFIFGLVLFGFEVNAQTKTNGVSAPPTTINIGDSSIPDFHPSLISIDRHPIPSAEYRDKKDSLYRKRIARVHSKNKKKSSEGIDYVPNILKTYEGNLPTGVPSDNDIAVSDNGIVISAVNSNLYFYDDTGKLLLNRSLAQMALQLGSIVGTSDPRLLYDPENDRFVCVFFTGIYSYTNLIIVGFSKTSDPTGAWNFYKLPGNSFKDSTWSDYPIISLSDDDLFMTFNHVKDSVSWTTGFRQSVIWQIDKERGYNGDSLHYTLWSDLKHNGRNFRNICPAKYQTTQRANNMYFLSVRNVDFSNDTIFLLEIDDSYQSGNAQFKTKVLRSPVKYGFPPNAFQGISKSATQQLMTNDARILAAVYENEMIHFGGNSINTSYDNAGVFIGSIKKPDSTKPQVSATIFSSEEIEYGYPSMTLIHDSLISHRILYTFSHCVTDSFAGMSMLYQNTKGEFSKIIRIKEGSHVIDILPDSVQRWGDYSNAQRRYSRPNEAYIVGSYGSQISGLNRARTWIAKIKVTDTVTPPPPPKPKPNSLLSTTEMSSSLLYPNPASDEVSFEFVLGQTELLHFRITDLQGKNLHVVTNERGYQGKNIFSMDIHGLASGTYLLIIEGEKSHSSSHQFIKR